MNYKLLFSFALVLNLFGCSSVYVPQEHPLRDGLIAPLTVSGDVQINNSQQSKDKVIVYSYGGSELESNYHDITQALVNQANKELKKNGTIQTSSNNKIIDIRVDYLESKYKFFYWNSEIKFTAKLGNGETLVKTVKHGSGSLVQDLNGCIAEAVIYLFKDEKVVNYLRSS